MDAPPQQATGTLRDAAERWWPVVVGVILVVGFPPIGMLFSLIVAWMRRWDRNVLIALITIAALGALYTAWRVSQNSGVVG